jgi:hypothetical protein
MVIEIYIPVLIKFKNDGIVFKDKVIDEICKKVYANFNKYDERMSKHDHFDYYFKDETIQLLLKKLHTSGLDFNKKDISGEFYYYHHRIIIKFEFKVADNFKGLRKLRSAINEFYPALINECVFNNINSVSDTTAVSFYSYMMMIVPKNKYQLSDYSDRLGSVTFSIIESTNKFLSYGNTHYVRISIPSIIVYYENIISNDTKVDLINLIYQNLLYEKKLSDKDSIFSDDLYDNLEKYNCIDESKLSLFWNSTMDMLGGKISERQAHSIDKHNYYLTLIGLFISVVLPGQTIYEYFGLRCLLIYFIVLVIGIIIFYILRYLKD